jgi:MFS family permease
MKSIARRNIKFHALINLISGAVFLLPVVTLFYKYTGLGLFEIIVVSNVMTFCLWLFELPTSVFADTMGRKRSMLYSVIANVLAALMILVYPTLWGFIIAAVFRALYYSFWSGTGLAFLDENLHILDEQSKFGRFLGKFMAYEQFAALFTPVVASLILKYFGDGGYLYLAILDVIFAVVLVFLVAELKEIRKFVQFRSVRTAIRANWKVAITGLKNVFFDSKLRLILIYRSLSHHMLYFSIILLPTLTDMGMPEWVSGGVITAAGIGALISTRYAYKFGEKFSYNLLWVLSSLIQGALMIAAGLFMNSWITVIAIYVLFDLFYGFWNPSWNHVFVEHSRGKAIATTRSIVMAVFALYITIGKQILSFIDVEYALIGLGIFIVLVNLVLGRKILKLKVAE